MSIILDSDVAATAVGVRNGRQFPFLLLPAELCNYVYDTLLDDSKNEMKLRHDPKAVPGSFFAFSGVCRQIRTEFQPLLANSYRKIEIRATDMFKFFETFSTRPLRPRILQIRVWLQDVTAEFKWDMRPFFDFKSSAPRGYQCLIKGSVLASDPFSRTSDHRNVLQTLFHAGNISRAFRADVTRGYISNVTYELRSNHLQLWTLTISKHVIGLQRSEIETLTRYCEFLCYRREPSRKMINIKVRNRKRKVFEQYMWVRTNYTYHRDGFHHSDWEHHLWNKIGNAPWIAPGLPQKPEWWDW